MSKDFAPPRSYGVSSYSSKEALNNPGYSFNNALPPARAPAANRAVAIGKRRYVDEDDYFNDEPDADDGQLEYQPAPGSPAHDGSDSDSDDPLDAFMEGVQDEVKALNSGAKKKPPKAIRDDIEQEDDQESYFRYIQEHPELKPNMDDDDIVGYDADGNPIFRNYKLIDPLPAVDHTEIDYEPFEKNFYRQHDDIGRLSNADVAELKRKLGIRMSGYCPPRPVSSFGHFGFDEALLKAIRKADFSQPTPIQAAAIPSALSGRDIIGIAKTGSGKTVAYLWPLLVHVMDQPELAEGHGPIGLIVAPTRELAQQIYSETKKFGKVYNLRSVCAYGGGSMYEQQCACQDGCELLICTPGRLIDLVKKKATNLRRVTFVIFDEADRMFDMGFEAQVRSIANHVRPDRQTLLFSATFKKKLERLARDILRDPVRIIQGDLGEANEDVTQVVEVFQKAPEKWLWLMRNIVKFCSRGSLLIFVTRKANSEEFVRNLKANDFDCLLIHGDMHQSTRNESITKFKRMQCSILVATDVAARGLDIPSIRTVINYDVARDIDTHIHRVGRTGRAGQKGHAYTLITGKDKEFAGHLVRNLEATGQMVPPALLDIAMQTAWFKNSRHRQSAGKQAAFVARKARPGLGASSDSSGNQSGSSSARSTASGPQTNRIGAVRDAFGASFKNSFRSAGVEASWQSTTAEPVKRKRSRWES